MFDSVSSCIGCRVPPHDGRGVRCVDPSSRAPEDGEGGSVFGFGFFFWAKCVVTAPAAADAVGRCALNGCLNPNASRRFIEGGLFWCLCPVASEVACHPTTVGGCVVLAPSSLADEGGEGARHMVFVLAKCVVTAPPAATPRGVARSG